MGDVSTKQVVERLIEKKRKAEALWLRIQGNALFFIACVASLCSIVFPFIPAENVPEWTKYLRVISVPLITVTIVCIGWMVKVLIIAESKILSRNIKSDDFNSLLKVALKKALNYRGVITYLDIFDTTGLDYIQTIKETLRDKTNDLTKIKNVRLLLCRHTDYRIDRGTADCNSVALENTRKELDTLLSLKLIEKYEIRYMDQQNIVHFCLLNKKVLFCGTNPISRKITRHNKCCHIVEDNDKCCHIVEDNDVIAENGIAFDSWFENRGFYDSGLMKRDEKICPRCCGDILSNIEEKDSRWEDMPLFVDKTSNEDFYIVPDVRPISNIHLVLICKYHVLNFYDYMKRSHLMNDKDREPGPALIELIKNIRSSIKTKLKEQGKEQEILVFEHGSLNPSSKNSAPSIDHLHLHVILRPKGCEKDGKLDISTIFNDLKYIESRKDERNKYVAVIEKYKSIIGFAHDPDMGNCDYFLVWDPSGAPGEDKVFVALKKKKPARRVKFSQYLRKVFYNKLDADEATAIYGKDIVDKCKKNGDKKEIWFNDKTRLVERTGDNKALYDGLEWPDANN